MQSQKTLAVAFLGIMLLMFAAVSHAGPVEDFFRLCAYGKHDEVIAAIKNGADVNSRAPDGASPLIVVVRASPNPLPAMRILIENGADVNIQDNDGMTALIYSALGDQLGMRKKGDPEKVIALLLDSGANPDLKNVKGKTALDFAVEMSKYEHAGISAEILKRLESATSAKSN
jgi:ankyrin repeat protein